MDFCVVLSTIYHPLLKLSLTCAKGLPWCSEGKVPATWETRVWSLGQEDPLEKEMATHSSILAWRMPWTEGVPKSHTGLGNFTSCAKGNHALLWVSLYLSDSSFSHSFPSSLLIYMSSWHISRPCSLSSQVFSVPSFLETSLTQALATI